MNLNDTIPAVAQSLRTGLNGDPDQRAATNLLIDAVNGVWLAKLSGWPQYLCPTQDTRRPGGLWIDWQQLRDDLTADDKAWAAFNDWATSYAGRQASEDTYEHTREQMVPRRPWHGASSSELVVLRIAVELAPGGLLGDGIARLDEANTVAVVTAVNTLVEGRYIEPDPAEPPASLRWGHPELVGRLPSGPDTVDLEDDRVSLLGDPSRHDEPPAGDDAGHDRPPPT